MDQFKQNQDEWREVYPGFEQQACGNDSDPHAKNKNTESRDYDSDWADTSLEEIKAGLKQISSALKHAFEHGKEDPRFKKFGEDVKESVNNISEEITDFFNKLG